MNNILEQLTPLERHILNHRLDASDAIADALSDCPEPYTWDFDTIDEVAQMLRHDSWQMAIEVGTKLVQDIIWDCIDGDVFVDISEDAWLSGEISQQKLSAIQRAGDSLKAKVLEWLGPEYRDQIDADARAIREMNQSRT